MTGRKWCCAVRFALVVPRLLIDRTALVGGAGCYLVSEPPGPWLTWHCSLGNPDPRSAVQPVNPACFSGGRCGAGTALAATSSGRNPNRAFQVMLSTPQRDRSHVFRTCSGPFLRTPKSPIKGRQFLAPRPQPACGVIVSEPIWDDRRGPKTHSPNRSKTRLSRLRPSRTSTTS